MKKILSIIVAIMMLTSIMIFSAGCEEKEDKYEIKLYYDNWDEVIRDRKEAFIYDENPKIYNAIGFKNGVEFIRLVPTDPESYKKLFITISINNHIDPNFLPTKIGSYTLRYQFNPFRDDVPLRGRSDSKIEIVIKIIEG